MLSIALVVVCPRGASFRYTSSYRPVALVAQLNHAAAPASMQPEDAISSAEAGARRRYTQRMEINGIAHIQLTVADFAAARAFYGQLLPFLGLAPVMDLDVFYYCVGARTGVAISPVDEAYAGDRFAQRRVGLHHVCFRAR